MGSKIKLKLNISLLHCLKALLVNFRSTSGAELDQAAIFEVATLNGVLPALDCPWHSHRLKAGKVLDPTKF